MKNEYLQDLMLRLADRNPAQPEFLQAVRRGAGVPGARDGQRRRSSSGRASWSCLVEPERSHPVPGALGGRRRAMSRSTGATGCSSTAPSAPIRAACASTPPSTVSIIKFLGFEQIFKNSLTGLPIGGGKGGSDFDPKGKSDAEVMRFCQSFMTELLHATSARIPTCPPGTSAWAAGRSAISSASISASATSSPAFSPARASATAAPWPGPRPPATACATSPTSMLRANGQQLRRRQPWSISGSGNVAIYACQKATQLGAKVVAMSDSNGYVVRSQRHRPASLCRRSRRSSARRIKDVCWTTSSRRRVSWRAAPGIWTVPCDIALPCATQNELDEAVRQGSW